MLIRLALSWLDRRIDARIERDRQRQAAVTVHPGEIASFGDAIPRYPLGDRSLSERIDGRSGSA